MTFEAKKHKTLHFSSQCSFLVLIRLTDRLTLSLVAARFNKGCVQQGVWCG